MVSQGAVVSEGSVNRGGIPRSMVSMKGLGIRSEGYRGTLWSKGPSWVPCLALPSRLQARGDSGRREIGSGALQLRPHGSQTAQKQHS